MPLPGNYVNATLRYGVAARELQLNVVWYTVTGAIGGADHSEDANMIADQIQSTFSGVLAAVMTTETELHGVQVSYNVGGNVFQGSQIFDDTTGTVAEDTLPEYCAVVIQKRTSAAGKSGRGRWYIGCVPETFANNGELTLIADALYKALADAFKLSIDVGGASLSPFLYSRTLDNTTAVTVTKVDQGLGTLRRRKARPLI